MLHTGWDGGGQETSKSNVMQIEQLQYKDELLWSWKSKCQIKPMLCSFMYLQTIH